MKDRSDFPSHHKLTLLPRSNTSLPPLYHTHGSLALFGCQSWLSNGDLFLSVWMCGIPSKGNVKEGNVFVFNNALNTFYLRLYGVILMVKDHSDSEKGNQLPPHRLLFRLIARVLLYASSHRQDNTYHGLCYTSRGALPSNCY